MNSIIPCISTVPDKLVRPLMSGRKKGEDFYGTAASYVQDHNREKEVEKEVG